MTVSFAQLATEFWVTGRKERLLYRFLSLSSIWVIAGQLIYWQADTLAGLILTGPFQAVAFGCLLLLFTFLGVREQISPQDPPHFIPREWLRALPFLALALLMFPLVLYIPMGEEFAHHWSFYTGPAELVRAGGWLLHDVPSQYGFLNIALLAALPGANSFQNLYFITALFYVLSSVLFYALWVRVFPSRAGRALGFPVILAFLFFCPGWVQDLSGPMALPSVGPFRFIFAEFMLVAVFIVENRASRGKPLILHLLLANLLWVIGVLWSAESAAYCSAVWLPCTGLLLWSSEAPRTPKVILKWLGLPIGFFLAAIGFISILYRVHAGFFPDWEAFVEYPLAYTHGFGSLPADPKGAVWYLLGSAALLLFLARIALTRPELKSSRATLVACLSLFWITGSYFTSRSHENNILNLLPIHLLCALLVISALSVAFRGSLRSQWPMFLPALVVPMAAVFCNPTFMDVYAARVEFLSSPAFRHQLLDSYRLRGEIALLLKSAEVTPAQPITFLWYYLLVYPNGTPQVQQFWLPIAPQSEFTILPESRQEVYIQRWLQKFPRNEGYVLSSRQDTLNSHLTPILSKNGYSLEKEWNQGEWLLQRFRRAVGP